MKLSNEAKRQSICMSDKRALSANIGALEPSPCGRYNKVNLRNLFQLLYHILSGPQHRNYFIIAPSFIPL